jgi:hypothetical protein
MFLEFDQWQTMMLVLTALTSAFRFKVLMALSRHFWGMTGDEEFFTPLLLIPS